MVKHIIIWDFKDDLDLNQKKAAAVRIKNELEALAAKINGIVDIKVEVDLLPTSNGSLMLDSTFTDLASLRVYADHPEHIKVKEYIGTVVKNRKCVDYEI